MSGTIKEVRNKCDQSSETENGIAKEVLKSETTIKMETPEIDDDHVKHDHDVKKQDLEKINTTDVAMKEVESNCVVQIKTEDFKEIGSEAEQVQGELLDFEFVNVQFEDLFHSGKIKEEEWDVSVKDNGDISGDSLKDAIQRYTSLISAVPTSVGDLDDAVTAKTATEVYDMMDSMKTQEIIAGFTHVQQETHKKVAESIVSLRDMLGEYTRPLPPPLVIEEPSKEIVEESIEETIERARRFLDRIDLSDPKLPGGANESARKETIAEKMRILESKIDAVIKKSNQPML